MFRVPFLFSKNEMSMTRRCSSTDTLGAEKAQYKRRYRRLLALQDRAIRDGVIDSEDYNNLPLARGAFKPYFI